MSNNFVFGGGKMFEMPPTSTACFDKNNSRYKCFCKKLYIKVNYY